MARLLRPVLTAVALAATAAAAVVWLSEARRHAAHGRALEADVAGLRQRVDELEAALSAARETVAARDRRIAFLDAEAVAAVRRAETVARAVDAKLAELDARRDDLEAQRIEARAPMPDGVRLALETLGDQLRADGHEGLRFLRARALDAEELRDVELIETSPFARRVRYVRAGVLTAELDREHGTVVLRLRDGHALSDGVLEDLPDAGLELQFADVDGPTWERRLPYLVRAAGEYPDDVAAAARRAVLDPMTADRWRRRLGTLLDLAGTDLRYELGRFRSVGDGRLVGASLHGYDGRRLLMQSAEVARLAVEVDREAGVVALLLEDGVLRQRSGETTIPATGYRILLPGVTPGQAIDAMLGFVVER